MNHKISNKRENIIKQQFKNSLLSLYTKNNCESTIKKNTEKKHNKSFNITRSDNNSIRK